MGKSNFLKKLINYSPIGMAADMISPQTKKGEFRNPISVLSPIAALRNPEAAKGFYKPVGDVLTGHDDKFIQRNRFDPEQVSALHQLLSQGLAGSSMDFGPNDIGQLDFGPDFADKDFGPIEDRARQQFQSNTIPSLAERFTAMFPGAESAQRSSGFAGEIGRAGSDLESQLASLRSDYTQNMAQLRSQMGIQKAGMGLDRDRMRSQIGMQRAELGTRQAGMGLTPQFDDYMQPGRPGMLEHLLAALTKAGVGYATGGF